MHYLNLIILIGCTIQCLRADETRLLDLEPNDAQNLIEQQDQTLKYAPKIESDVPAVRFLGQEAHNVLEDIYLAKQYHGQDGLGGYLYGYQVPDIAKNEEKKPGGNLKGAYNYVNGAGQEIRVEYWDDGHGFHQKDNIPEILPQQIEDLPEVKAAKEEFLKRWQEEAERNTRPVENPYNNAGQYASGPLSVQGQQERAKLFAQPQQQHQLQYDAAASQRFPTQSYQPQPAASSTYNQEIRYQNAIAESQQKAAAAINQQQQEASSDGAYNSNDDDEGKYIPGKDEESTGPPKGFFYAYDYPVGIIKQDLGRALPVQKRSSNLKNIYEENKQKFERQLLQGKAIGNNRYLITRK